MIYYLSSIPRSGSTLLASLLSQRSDTYVSPTSNLGEILGAMTTTFLDDPSTGAGECTDKELFRMLNGTIEAKYSDRVEPIIFDKGRFWPGTKVMETMREATGEPIKIVATVRPMAECVASFMLVDGATNAKQWMKKSPHFEHLMFSYDLIRTGYEKYPSQFCLIEYENLVTNPQHELDRVSAFLGVDTVAFNPVIEQVKENDNAWGVKDLHKLNPKIENQNIDARKILGHEMFEYFQGGNFWSDEPNYVSPPKPLDISLEAGLHGNFTKALEILREEEKLSPECDRVAFNLGWYEMMKGNLQKGHRLLDRGRNEHLFGTPDINFDRPCWNGQRDCTVLMEMEGGFGDQFHSIRFAKNLASNYGCKVIIGGCLPLAPIMRQIEGVHSIVAHEGSRYVDFDYWIPSMSAIIPLGLEYSDLSGESYIPRLCEPEDKVGVKWAGNPEFEHQQHRLFPAELMFDTVKDEDCISLQKGDLSKSEAHEIDPSPEWMETPSLETWMDTQKAISRCDLVVTSCTGVAHLAGAMGVETWVIIPILPYYLWALPGNKTPYYDSVKLYRQEKHGCWKAPFKNIKQDLIARRVRKWGSNYGKITQQFIEA